MEQVTLSWDEVDHAAGEIAHGLYGSWQHKNLFLYGVPRGGIFAAQAVYAKLLEMNTLVEASKQYEGRRRKPINIYMTTEINGIDTVIIDDVIDSGETMKRHKMNYPTLQFQALVDKRDGANEWISFPWERMVGEGEGIEDNITRIIQFIGDDPTREGLAATPARVARAYGEIFSGYKQDLDGLFTTFEEDTCDEMVVLKDIEFYSVCEHHMQPFYGKAHVAYIPSKKVVGVSKLARVVDVFARRLQIQERLCKQVAHAIQDHLQPQGVGVVLEAKHLCMMCRGVQKQHSTMITSELLGAFRKPEVRLEFLNFISKGWGNGT
jgi:GTP cyclohydrolase I